MIHYVRVFLWKIVSELEMILNPYDSYQEDDYYIKVKNDETGETYFIMDWIKSHKEQIERLQEEMLWVKCKLNELEQWGSKK